MSARDDYPELASADTDLFGFVTFRDALRNALNELDRLRAQVKPTPITNRILWNVRGGDIDEVVMSDCTVHVEQMDDRCWWIGIRRADGGYWAGNFYATSRGVMTFTEQDFFDFQWDREDAHEEAT